MLPVDDGESKMKNGKESGEGHVDLVLDGGAFSAVIRDMDQGGTEGNAEFGIRVTVCTLSQWR